LATLTSEIDSQGAKASFVVTDVAKDVERMVAHAIETFGRLDYAVNNAAIEAKFAGITDLAEQEWDRVLDTNLKRTFLCLK
jgi:NAD(P)-dependent dehydrogenase (short-subunit alcohol dehydrogenase family)